MERNHTLRRSEKSQGDLAHSLDPTDDKSGLSSGSNIHTERKPLARKGKLSDMTEYSCIMENHIYGSCTCDKSH